MANSVTPTTWYSGNYKKDFNKAPPYNGIEIVGSTVYDEESGNFISVSLTLTDYTNVLAGSDLVVPALTNADGEHPIGAPTVTTSPPSSPPQTNTDFTMDGWVSLESNGLDYSLRIYLSFGMEHAKSSERGYIMSFAKKLAPPTSPP